MDQPLLIVVPILSYNTHIIFHTCVESIHRCFTILYYCVSPIMVCREIQTASSKDDELILLLMNGLPQPNRQLWYNTDELQNILKLEGLPSLPEKLVANALRTNRKYMIALSKKGHIQGRIITTLIVVEQMQNLIHHFFKPTLSGHGGRQRRLMTLRRECLTSLPITLNPLH